MPSMNDVLDRTSTLVYDRKNRAFFVTRTCVGASAILHRFGCNRNKPNPRHRGPCAGTEFKTKKEKVAAPKFNVVSFGDDHPAQDLRGKVYVKTTDFEERLRVLQQDPSLPTGVLRGLKERISELAHDHVPSSVIYAKIPEMAKEICTGAGLEYDTVDARRYLLTTDQVHNIVRENKRSALGHNIGDLAQTQSLIETAAATHFVHYTPLIFNGVRGGPVQQNFRLMFMDKEDVGVLKRRGSHKVFLDSTHRVNQVRLTPVSYATHLLPFVTLLLPFCYPSVTLMLMGPARLPPLYTPGRG
jgi:hypothetical protein